MSKKLISKTIKIAVRTVLGKFPNKVLYLGDIKNNYISSPSVNRAGLQLASGPNKSFTKINSLILWGVNENNYLASLSTDSERIKHISNVLKLYPPLIILCNGFTYFSLIEKISRKYKTTIVTSQLHSHQLYLSISGWLNLNLAEYVMLHGTVIYMSGIGILIRGESGVGKSEVALQLIKHGALFIADDAVEIANIGFRLFARPTKISKTFLEVRWIGLINIARMFGISTIKKSTHIDIIIDLVNTQNLSRQYFERIGNIQKYETLLGVNVPHYNIPVTYGRDISNMIEIVINDYKLKSEGYNSAEEYITNYNSVLKRKK